jgi:hypothetical protein
MASLFESDSYILIDLILIFILITFNIQIGTIYLFMIALDWFIYYFASDKNIYKVIPLETNSQHRLMSVITSAVIFIAFYFFIAYVNMRFSGLSVTQGTYLSQLGQVIASTFSATPILGSSDYMKLVVWGILIPIVETRFFFRTLMQWGTNKFAGIKIPTDIFSITAIWVSAFWGLLFMVFHIVAKGISNNQALVVTFLFGFFSVMCVIYFQQAIQAIFLHVLWNTVGTMYQLNIGFASSINSGIMITVSLVLIAWALLFQQLPFISKKGVGF